MTTNEELINTFYTAFQKGDYKTMQACYHDEAIFSDPVFNNLNANQVRSMWEMFCVKSKDLNISFSNVSADDSTGRAEWIATYPFSKTGNKVTNHISARFIFKDGKIIKHTDTFSFYKWASQALGMKGTLLGWTGFVKKKVQSAGLKSLNDYMNSKG